MPEQQFDPNKYLEEFDPNEYAATATEEAAKDTAGTFDPDTYAEEQKGLIESVISGAAEGATLGYSDEIIGKVAAGLAKLSGAEEDYDTLYKNYRDEVREHQRLTKEQHPVGLIDVLNWNYPLDNSPNCV